jgi:WD40 repeat protein
MGNCQANSQHIYMDNPTTRSPSRKPLVREGKDSTESTIDFDRETDSVTVALSPSTLSPVSVSPLSYYSLSPLTPKHQYLSLSSSHNSTQQDVSAYNIVASPKRKQSLLDAPSSPRRQGRALQHRLEKARYVQMTLSHSASNHSLGSKASASLVSSHSHTPEDDPSNSIQQQLPIVPYRYSLSQSSIEGSSSVRQSSDKLNDEFEATISRATIWAEVEHFDKVLAVALSRNTPSLNKPTPRLYLAAGTEDGTVTVTELLDDSPISTTTFINQYSNDNNNNNSPPDSESQANRLGESLTVHRQGRIRSLDFSPDGQYLVVGGDDCACAIFRLVFEPTEEEDEPGLSKLSSLELCGQVQRVDRVYAVQFSPNGRYLAVGGFDGAVAIVVVEKIPESEEQDVTAEISTDGLIFTLDWSPDGRYLAFGGSDKCCSIVDVEESWQVFQQIKRPSTVQAVKWHPNAGRYLAIGSGDVVIVDGEYFKPKHVVNHRGQSSGAGPSRSKSSVYRVNALCWSPNGSYLVVCDSDQSCTLVEGKGFTAVHEVRRGGNVNSAVWGQQSAISGLPRRYLVLGGDDHKVVLLKAGLEISSGTSSMGDDLSSSAGSSYFSNRGDWTLKENAFRDVDDMTEFAPARNNCESQGEASVTVAAFSRGSKSRPSAFFAYATDDGIVTVRSTVNWEIITELVFPKLIRSLTFSNGSKHIALACDDSTVYVVEIPSWSVIAAKDLGAPILSVVFSKNNERLAVGSADGILSLIDPLGGWEATGEIESSASPVLTMDWCSRNLAVGRQDGSVSIYDSEQVYSNFCVALVELFHKSPVRSVAFGASGRFIAVGGDDGLLHLYSSKGGWVLCHQVKADHGIFSIKWSPTGRFMAFGGENGLFQVIDTIFWAEVDEAKALISSGPSNNRTASISTVAFSQDGKLISYGGQDFGTRIVDSSTWEIAFTLQQMKDEMDDEMKDEEAAESSISSQEGDLDAAHF